MRASKILIYGPEGVGKSSWAAGSQRPLFLDFEDGIPHLPVPKIRLKNVANLNSIFEEVAKKYSTLVIDSLDGLQRAITSQLLAKNGWESIESPGFGRGYAQQSESFSAILDRLDKLTEGGVEVIIIAHAASRICQNPAGLDFQKTEPLAEKRICASVKSWVDHILFAAFERVSTQDGQHAAKCRSIRRIIFTTHGASFDAKNRCELPNEIELKYDVFNKYRQIFNEKLLKKSTATPNEKPTSDGGDQ